MPLSLSGLFASAPAVLLTALLAFACGTEPPPPPTKLVLAAAPSATAETMVPLATQPVVQAADASGRAAPATVTVTAEVVSGNGAVVAGGSATTDASGRATFSNLTLGGMNGVVGALTLQFSAPGLAPVTAPVELRCAVVPLAVGQTVNAALTTGDCAFRIGGGFFNLFELATSQAVTAVQLTLDGLDRPSLNVRGPNEPPPYFWGWEGGGGSRSISFKALLPAGRNLVAATTFHPGRTGSYSLTVGAASEDLMCEFVIGSGLAIQGPRLTASPITTAQQLGAGDCSVGSFLEDRLVVGLPENASITVSMSSGAFQPRVNVIEAFSHTVVASATAPGTASVTYTNGTNPAYYNLILTSEAAGGAGAYTLSLNITYPASATSAAAAALRLPGPLVMQRGSAPPRR